ncbi:MAG: GNAT family N-acetyltransferase [Planctomycetota bacterium]|jgi:putative acetyltransferase
MTEIRQEQPEDITAIRMINELAFGRPEEADIVDKLRENCSDTLSLVAVQEGQIIGHIFFSPVVIENDEKEIHGMGLAPMAVIPDYQRKGVGSMLVKAGIEKIKQTLCPFIIALGHPEFYPCFGFERASIYGIRSQWEVPDEAFMVLILDNEVMSGVSGTASYREEFNEAM